MDVKLQWKVSAKVESLVDVIVECRKQLVECVKQRNQYNLHMKTLSCDVYASPKLVELLGCSQLWKPVIEFTEEDLTVRPSHRQKPVSELVADFELFKLHRDQIIGDEAIRVIMAFEVGVNAFETFYGNIELQA